MAFGGLQKTNDLTRMIKSYIKQSLKYILRSYPFIRKYVMEVDRMYSMSLEELRERNEKRFLEMFRKLWNSSDYYVSLCKLGGGNSC